MFLFGILLGVLGKFLLRRRVLLVFIGLIVGVIFWGFLRFIGVNRGGGGGGFGFFRIVRIVEGCVGGLMRGVLVCILIFFMLEVVVLLELLFRVFVLELLVILFFSCRLEVRVLIWLIIW